MSERSLHTKRNSLRAEPHSRLELTRDFARCIDTGEGSAYQAHRWEHANASTHVDERRQLVGTESAVAAFTFRIGRGALDLVVGYSPYGAAAKRTTLVLAGGWLAVLPAAVGLATSVGLTHLDVDSARRVASRISANRSARAEAKREAVAERADR